MKKKILIGFGVLVVGVLGYAGVRFGPDMVTAYRQGFFEKSEKVSYEGTAKDNLKSLYTAMMLYHDSEGQFPEASGWLDAISLRLNTADLKEGEAEKKKRDPRLSGEGYGFAMNSAAGKQYKDDLGNPDEFILIFDSSDVSNNAHGAPEKLAPEPPRKGGRLAITLSGKVLIDGKLSPD